MKNLKLFLMLVSVSGFIWFSKANSCIHKNSLSEMEISGTEYYCPKCKIELLPASKNVWVDSDKDCQTCDGDGLVDDVDKYGNIIKNGRECDICHGSGKKQKLITINYLYCSKCHSEYSYPE